MANYEPVRVRRGQVSAIPLSARRTMIVAAGGNLLISSDAVMNRANAIPLAAGRSHEMPANVTWLCALDNGQFSGELRRMDLE